MLDQSLLVSQKCPELGFFLAVGALIGRACSLQECSRKNFLKLPVTKREAFLAQLEENSVEASASYQEFLLQARAQLMPKTTDAEIRSWLDVVSPFPNKDVAEPFSLCKPTLTQSKLQDR